MQVEVEVEVAGFDQRLKWLEAPGVAVQGITVAHQMEHLLLAVLVLRPVGVPEVGVALLVLAVAERVAVLLVGI